MLSICDHSITFYRKIRVSFDGDRLLIIRIDQKDDFGNYNKCSKLRVWQLNDRSPEHHWKEFENFAFEEGNLCKSYPFYAVNFPSVIGGI